MSSAKPLLQTARGSAQNQTHNRSRLVAILAFALVLAGAPSAFGQGTDCLIVGPSIAECGILQFFVGSIPLNQHPFDVTWSFVNDSAGSSFVGPNSCVGVNSCPVTINVSTVGSVTVHAHITTWNGIQKDCEQTLTVVDVTPPTITCPPDASVQCGASTDPTATGFPTATDTCGATSLSYVDAAAGVNCAGAIITRTWTAQDTHGNSATCTQTITTVDTTPPSLTCPAAVGLQCLSALPPPDVNSVTASDNCGGSVTVTHAGDVESNPGSNCNNVITRTYQGVDACGNVGTCTQLITVNDNTPPSLTCPAATSVQCLALVPTPDTNSVTSSDNCNGLVTVTHAGDVESNPGSNCNNVITRTYQGVDSCGNVGTCTQLITVNDNTPPSLTCPGAALVQCLSAVPTPDVNSVTTSDNCNGLVTVTHAGDVQSNPGSNCNNVITRTYQGVDSCGNVGTCTQLITVNDDTPPVLTCPLAAVPVGIQCLSLVPAPNPSLVTASDNCGGLVTVTHASDVQSNPGSNCNNVITRTYQGVDSCGNVGTCTQQIFVNDNTPPTLTCPAAASAQCLAAIPAPDVNSVTASDNCGGLVTVTHAGDVQSNPGSNCNNVITRTYQGVDSCGNVGTCTQQILVNDNTPPILTCPLTGAPVGVQCLSLVPAPDPSSVGATDNCGGLVTVTHAGDVQSNPGSSCNNVITRTYQGVDSCGNVGTCTQLITVNDNTPPTLTCPAATSAQCLASIPGPDVNSVSTSDNCGGPVTVTHVGDVQSNPGSNCNNVITRTYQGVDGCGNVGTCTQLITVNDNTPPSLTCPAAVGLQCLSSLPPPDISSVTSSDNCGGPVTVTHVGDVQSNPGSNCNNVITRTYQGVDGCGNVGTCTQLITVNDNTPPIPTCPPDFTLPCGTPTGPIVTGTATATDNCDPNPVVTFSDSTVGSCPAGAVITRTWTATDACGNQGTCTQTITLLQGPGQGCLQATVQNLGGGCGEGTAPLLTSSVPTLGSYLSFHIDSLTNNSQILFAGMNPPVANIPIVPGCMLHLDPGNPSTIILDYYYTDDSGKWTSRFLLDAIPELVNVQFVLQAGIISPGGPLGFAQLTNALLITIGTCPPYCTFSREDYADGGVPGNIFDTNWLFVFPGGMDVGIFNPGNGPTYPNGIHWTGDVAGRTALKTFLGGAGALPAALMMDAINATNGMGSGTLARQTAVLRLNVQFNAAGLIGTPTPGFGALIYFNPYNLLDSLNGMTVNQILTLADTALAGLGLPSGYTFLTFATLLEELSLAFANCTPSFWSSKHLFVSPL